VKTSFEMDKHRALNGVEMPFALSKSPLQ